MWKLNCLDLDRVEERLDTVKITAPAKIMASATLFKEDPHSSYAIHVAANMDFPFRKENTRSGLVNMLYIVVPNTLQSSPHDGLMAVKMSWANVFLTSRPVLSLDVETCEVGVVN